MAERRSDPSGPTAVPSPAPALANPPPSLQGGVGVLNSEVINAENTKCLKFQKCYAKSKTKFYRARAGLGKFAVGSGWLRLAAVRDFIRPLFFDIFFHIVFKMIFDGC